MGSLPTIGKLPLVRAEHGVTFREAKNLNFADLVKFHAVVKEHLPTLETLPPTLGQPFLNVGNPPAFRLSNLKTGRYAALSTHQVLAGWTQMHGGEGFPGNSWLSSELVSVASVGDGSNAGTNSLSYHLIVEANERLTNPWEVVSPEFLPPCVHGDVPTVNVQCIFNPVPESQFSLQIMSLQGGTSRIQIAATIATIISQDWSGTVNTIYHQMDQMLVRLLTNRGREEFSYASR